MILVIDNNKTMSVSLLDILRQKVLSPISLRKCLLRSFLKDHSYRTDFLISDAKLRKRTGTEQVHSSPLINPF